MVTSKRLSVAPSQQCLAEESSNSNVGGAHHAKKLASAAPTTVMAAAAKIMQLLESMPPISGNFALSTGCKGGWQ